MQHTSVLCALLHVVLFLTTRSKVKMLMKQHGEENRVAADRRARGNFSGEGISEPSLNYQRGHMAGATDNLPDRGHGHPPAQEHRLGGGVQSGLEEDR